MENSACGVGAVLRVAVKTPVDGLFDYLPADGTHVRPGQRVVVPFGRTEKTGIVVEIGEKAQVDADRLRRIASVPDDEPVLDTAMLSLLRWAADYYQHPLGDVVLNAVPVALRKSASWPSPEPAWQLTAGEVPDLLGRAPLQSRAVELLASRGVVGRDELSSVLGTGWRRAINALLDKAIVERAPVEVPGPSEVHVSGTQPALNEDQALALKSFEPGHWGAALLDGVTGSGKTEVYLRMIEMVARMGKQSLVLVPEIGLTPQLADRVKSRFETSVVTLHSGLSDRQRLVAWARARSGEARIVVGTRSAVFTPLPDLGLIIVDEEHDTSYKQQEGFRYSARDLAVIRARRDDVPVVLGSATPSFESLENARAGRYHRLALPKRAGGAKPPTVHVIDLRATSRQDGLSAPLREAMKTHLEEGGQVLLYLNRRGFAPTLMCPTCGEVAECRRCDARLVVHQKSARLACHHCGSSRPLDAHCESCDAEMIAVGQGTERVEEAIATSFPDWPAARIDRDTTRSASRLSRIFDDARSGAIKILLGTQMLTKGHDFHGVTMVGVIDADQGLFGTDFRSAERLAQTFVQVAGRAGRGQRRGEVYLQTHFPDHPLLRRLIGAGYGAFADDALEVRRQSGWPPYSYLALLRAEANETSRVFDFLNLARDAVGTRGSVEILGPASAPMARRSGRFRGQLLIRADDRGSLHRTVAAMRAAFLGRTESRRVRWSIDVDPCELF